MYKNLKFLYIFKSLCIRISNYYTYTKNFFPENFFKFIYIVLLFLIICILPPYLFNFIITYILVFTLNTIILTHIPLSRKGHVPYCSNVEKFYIKNSFNP